ncbi:MAG: protein jag [Desulfobacterales bacterium]|nr:protein jag [Desulfobacterales bacterium]
MSSGYEFEGKTKEEAVKNACEELDLSEDQLEFEVISYGSTGIFGLVGAKKAKIRVKSPESPELETGQNDNVADEREEVGEIAKKTLEQIISFIADDGDVTVVTQSNGITLKVETDNSAILIGKHGKTLEAIQYVVQKVVYKEKRTRLRISIDVGGYRDRRKVSLTQLALRLGEKVKRSGKPATISPMNAYDRRIVHVALQDDNRVRTQSMGSGSFRKLVILPHRRQR